MSHFGAAMVTGPSPWSVKQEWHPWHQQTTRADDLRCIMQWNNPHPYVSHSFPMYYSICIHQICVHVVFFLQLNPHIARSGQVNMAVSVAAEQFARRDHLFKYTKVAPAYFAPRHDQMTPLMLPSVQILVKQKQHRLWLLCDFADPAGPDASSSLSSSTSHMSLSGCENTTFALMLSWVLCNLWLTCCLFVSFLLWRFLHG